MHGTAKTIRIVSLPDLPDKGDVSDWLDADPHRAKKFANVCFDVPLWEPTGDETPPPDKPETATPEASTESKPAMKHRYRLSISPHGMINRCRNVNGR